MADLTERKGWMGLLARSDAAQLAALAPKGIDYGLLRAPEVGAVAVRARMGGTGAPFNLGEMTVTRCSLRLPGGVVGHGYVQGRDKAHATRAALIDALMQTSAAPAIRRAVLEPLAKRAQAARDARAGRAAATQVTFFTMIRGED